MRALVLVDLQEDFLDVPGLAERREALVAGVRAWIDWARRRDLPLIEVRTVLPHDRDAWARNMRDDDQPVVLQGTPGARRLAELELTPHTTVTKRRDDAFHGTDLAGRLAKLGADEIVLGGVSTEACIAMTAASAYAHDLLVHLADGAVASADPQAHRMALGWLEQQYRQRVVSVDDL